MSLNLLLGLLRFVYNVFDPYWLAASSLKNLISIVLNIYDYAFLVYIKSLALLGLALVCLQSNRIVCSVSQKSHFYGSN